MSTKDTSSELTPTSHSPPQTTPTSISTQKQADSLLGMEETNGVGASLEPYDKDSLTGQLQELESTLAHSRIFPHLGQN